MLTITLHSLREAINNRLVWVALALVLLAFLFVEFVGALALTEHRVIQATLLASVLRVVSIFLLLLFVVASVLREQRDGSLEAILSLPLSRFVYVLGKAGAHGIIAVVMSVVCGVVLLFHAAPAAVLGWSLSLACELLLVGAFGLLLAFTFRQTVAAVAAFTVIYLFARVTGALQLMITQPIFSGDGPARGLIEHFLLGLAWVLPALHRFTEAGWLAEQGPGTSDLLYVVGQTLVYLPLLLVAAAVDLYRREF